MQIKVGVIGLGYWGPNHVRNFIRHEKTQVLWGCDLSEQALVEIKKFYPHLKITQNYRHLLKDKSLDLIVIATPPDSHFEIAKAALEANKHVIIAKPLASNSTQASELLKIAKRKNLLIHGDLTYLYTGAVRKIKKLIKNKVIGNPLYYDSTRTNLGLIQIDVNVIWDLAPHDLSIIDYLFNLKPLKIFAIASKHHKQSLTEEMAHITISYETDFIAHIHVSWLSPVKIRTILIGGTEKMILFDDLEPDEKVRIYDKGIKMPEDYITPFKPAYRGGDVIIPKLDQEEALFSEIENIANQITNKNFDYLNAKLNIEIIKLLEACDLSLKEGRPINLK